MADEADDVKTEQGEPAVPESPATWENVLVGKAKELLGKAIGDGDLAEQGAEQEEIAHDVRDEYRDEHPS